MVSCSELSDHQIQVVKLVIDSVWRTEMFRSDFVSSCFPRLPFQSLNRFNWLLSSLSLISTSHNEFVCQNLLKLSFFRHSLRATSDYAPQSASQAALQGWQHRAKNVPFDRSRSIVRRKADVRAPRSASHRLKWPLWEAFHFICVRFAVL